VSVHEFVAEFRREVERLALENRDLRARVAKLEEAARAGATYIAQSEAEHVGGFNT